MSCRRLAFFHNANSPRHAAGCPSQCSAPRQGGLPIEPSEILWRIASRLEGPGRVTSLETVDFLGGIAGIASLAVVLWSYRRLTESTKDHLEAHLAAVRTWAVGSAGVGWSRDQLTRENLLDWVHPVFWIVPLAIGSSFYQLTGLENVVLSREMRRAVVSLGLSIEAFNAHLQRVQAFETGDSATLVAVATELTRVLGTREERIAVIEEEGRIGFAQILARTRLNEEQRAWATMRADMITRAHVTFIGDERGRGVYRRLRDLETLMRREGLFREFDPARARETVG